jgi:protein-disulfide isomerase
MKNKKVVLLSVVLLVVGFIAAAVFYQKGQDDKIEKIASKSSGAPFVREHSPKFGKNENKVTIVEFLDPECEACASFHPVIKKVFNEYYKETNLVVRYLDNHGNSKFAIRLLEAARIQGKYNEALEIIFNTQAQWADHNNPKPQLLWDFLPQAGLDMKKLRSDFENNYIDGMLNLDRTDAQKLQVRGTPTFFVNGKQLKKLGYQSLLDLVESELYK